MVAWIPIQWIDSRLADYLHFVFSTLMLGWWLFGFLFCDWLPDSKYSPCLDIFFLETPQFSRPLGYFSIRRDLKPLRGINSENRLGLLHSLIRIRIEKGYDAGSAAYD